MNRMSRRAVLSGLATVSVGGIAAAGGGEITSEMGGEVGAVVSVCRQWVSGQAEINTLQLEWARLEHQLSSRHADFFHLPEAKRGELPDGGSRMAQIDARIDELYEARDRQLPYLPRLKATSVEIVLAKLAVAQELVYEDEFPEAHRIIRDSIADLTRLWPGPGRTRTRQIA